MTDSTRASAGSEWRSHWTLVLAASAGMSLAAVSTYSIGVMIEPIQQDLGWSRAQISSGPALISLVAVCLSTFAGIAIDRIGARLIGLLSATLLCAALAAMSLATTSQTLWWFLWILIGLATSAMPTVWTAPILQFFERGRGLALAVTLSGTGIGAAIVPLVAGYFVVHHGWRSGYLAIGILWAVFALPLLLVFFTTRSETHQVTIRTTTRPANTRHVLAQALRTPAFYKLALAAFFVTLAGTALVLNIVPILTSAGISRLAAASVAGLTGVATIVGRIVGGHLMDRMPAHWIAFCCAIAAMVFPALTLMMPGSLTAAVIGVVIFGLSGGPKMAAIMYLLGRHFDARDFGTLFGAIHALLALGVGLGPLLASVIFDARGSYDLALWLTIPVLLGAAAMFGSLGSPPLREMSQTAFAQ